MTIARKLHTIHRLPVVSQHNADYLAYNSPREDIENIGDERLSQIPQWASGQQCCSELRKNIISCFTGSQLATWHNDWRVTG